MSDQMKSVKDEVGSKVHLILVYYRFQLKLVEDLIVILKESSLIRGPASKLFPRSGIDVVHDLLHLPLIEVGKDGLFGKDHPEHGMTFFDGSFLPGTHGITVVDGGTDEVVLIDFEGIRITKLRPAVGEDGMEKGKEVETAQL